MPHHNDTPTHTEDDMTNTTTTDYQVTRAPSGPYADLKICDWCGDKAAHWLITRGGWTEQACNDHAIHYFPQLFDVAGRQLKFRARLVTDSGADLGWEILSDHGVRVWVNQITETYNGQRPVTRSVTLPDGRKAYSWTWTLRRPLGGTWSDTLRVISL